MVYDNVDNKRGGGMLCPVCRVGLVMSDRQGVEIDYCPDCRGVWLDRGELDKIIERSGADSRPAQSHDNDGYDAHGARQGHDSHGRGGHGYDSHGQRRHDDRGSHGGSFLRRLFD